MKREDAADELYDAIARRAAEDGVGGDELCKLADAYQRVTFGPQGGALRRDDSSSSISETTAWNNYHGRSHYTSDTHQTEHPSAEPRSPIGFDAPEEER